MTLSFFLFYNSFLLSAYFILDTLYYFFPLAALSILPNQSHCLR